MVYINKKDNKVISFVVTCNCGCGSGLEFKTLDGDVYISALSGEFFNKQGILNSTRKQIRDIFHRIIGKNVYLCDCCLGKEDMKNFLYAINNLELDEGNNDYYVNTNDGYLVAWSESITDCDSLYGIAIRPRMSILGYLRHKNYRIYELVYHFETWKHFVDICNQKFKDLLT